MTSVTHRFVLHHHVVPTNARRTREKRTKSFQHAIFAKANSSRLVSSAARWRTVSLLYREEYPMQNHAYSSSKAPQTSSAGPCIVVARSSSASDRSITRTIYTSSVNCPELSPEFVAHCFETLKYLAQYSHPLIAVTSIRSIVPAASFQLHLLRPESRVLVLCIIALASLISFNPSVLGAGPLPESFVDEKFFFSNPELPVCGVRRTVAFRAFRAEALKAAWEFGIILQPSNENAVSCYLLDLLEQNNIWTGSEAWSTASRPWASAYVSHVRALAPKWRASNFVQHDSGQWAGFLMGEALTSTRSRTSMLITLNDQLLLSGPEPPSLMAILTSLEDSTHKPGLPLMPMQPYLFHATCLARLLSEKINGDYPRLSHLSEAAVIEFLSALSLLHSILSLILGRVDVTISSATSRNRDQNQAIFLGDSPNIESIARACAYGVIVGFTGLVLPFYRELELRGTDDAQQNPRTRERMRVLRMRRLTRWLSSAGARWRAGCATFRGSTTHPCSGATSTSGRSSAPTRRTLPRSVRATSKHAMADELKLMGYSPDFSMPQAAMLIQRLDELKLLGCTLDFPAPQAATQIFDPATFDLAAYDMFIPLDPDVWCRFI
ncbi:hypothetical protein C8R44DRAFT_878127 [Mycena epipterygia]|nr:hypothetical protein C8R44DRAFT_878127 [Mycena epipterygia]